MFPDVPKNFYIFVFSTDSEVLVDSESHFFPCTTSRGKNGNVENDSEISWRQVSDDIVRKIFKPKSNSDGSNNWSKDFIRTCKLIRIFRLWFPVSRSCSKFLQRHIFWRKLSSDEREKFSTDQHFQWTSLDDFASKGLDTETAELVNKLKNSSNHDIGFKAQEFPEENFILDPDESLALNPAPFNHQLALTTAAKFGKEEQRLIFGEFFSRCLPHLFMDFPTFEGLASDLGWDKTSHRDLFRCFKQNSSVNPNYLSYNELIAGLAVCEPNMPHGDFAGEMRCRYIFKFYDKDGDNEINFDEFCAMVTDIRRLKKMSTNSEDVLKEATLTARVFGGENVSKLALGDFLVGVGQLKFRGTSALLRAPSSAPEILKGKCVKAIAETSGPAAPKKRRVENDENVDSVNAKKQETTPARNPSISAADLNIPSFLFSFDNDEEGAVSSAAVVVGTGHDVRDDFDYEFATHVIKVRRTGEVTEVQSLWELEGGSVTASAQFSSSLRFSFDRMASMTAFNASSEANEMLKGLRYFEKTSKLNPDKKAMSWGEVNPQTIATCLISISRQVKNLLIQEPRLLKIQAPVYVLGDIHGNFRDLICFEKSLWRMGTNITPSNFLFLGDYVDRGDYGVEVVAYLFAQKIVAPTKFHLLRGNHEVRSIQKSFTFYKECLNKFGKELGNKVWEEINLVFDVMPIAAVVDDKIFCVHGGIPPPWMGKNISSLNQISVELPDPELQEPLAWEYLWNDPLPADASEIPDAIRVELDSDESVGFVDNYRRRTGHMFSVKALNDFLDRNKLSLVIRAHEVKQSGFQVQLKQKLLTVFSSSKYCNGSNEAACVLIHNKKLRVICLDTS